MLTILFNQAWPISGAALLKQPRRVNYEQDNYEQDDEELVVAVVMAFMELELCRN